LQQPHSAEAGWERPGSRGAYRTRRRDHRVGKPCAPIFAAACHLCRAKPEEVIMIGDNLATDIAGANRLGLSSLLVLKHGVHGGLSDTALTEAMRSHGAAPTYIAPAFAW
jgi:ribonucleotide monophosphatase NagD (HAD superfamily)